MVKETLKSFCLPHGRPRKASFLPPGNSLLFLLINLNLIYLFYSWPQLILQSRPIKMRTPILYLANRWTKFKMLLTSNRFLYLIRFLLLSFPLIPQFIAQFRSICLFLCSSPYFLPVATKWELEQSMHCPLCHCCHSFLFSPSERTKWRSKKVLKSLS